MRLNEIDVNTMTLKEFLECDFIGGVAHVKKVEGIKHSLNYLLETNKYDTETNVDERLRSIKQEIIEKLKEYPDGELVCGMRIWSEEQEVTVDGEGFRFFVSFTGIDEHIVANYLKIDVNSKYFGVCNHKNAFDLLEHLMKL